jgi:hypothetical protein
MDWIYRTDVLHNPHKWLWLQSQKVPHVYTNPSRDMNLSHFHAPPRLPINFCKNQLDFIPLLSTGCFIKFPSKFHTYGFVSPFVLQRNLDSQFLSGVLKNKRDGYGKMIDVGTYIKVIKTIIFAYVYILNQKTYTNDITRIYTVKSNWHYLFLKTSLIHICLAVPFSN